MILKKFLGFLPGQALRLVGQELNRAYQMRLNAKNDAARIKADGDIAALKARQMVLIAEQQNGLTRWIRPAFALPFIIYNTKIILWDKVLALGSTDPLSEQFWQLQMVIFGAYFLTRPFEKIKLKD